VSLPDCPNCGGVAMFHRTSIDGREGGQLLWAFCGGRDDKPPCGLSGPFEDDDDDDQQPTCPAWRSLAETVQFAKDQFRQVRAEYARRLGIAELKR